MCVSSETQLLDCLLLSSANDHPETACCGTLASASPDSSLISHTICDKACTAGSMKARSCEVQWYVMNMSITAARWEDAAATQWKKMTTKLSTISPQVTLCHCAAAGSENHSDAITGLPETTAFENWHDSCCISLIIAPESVFGH